jgi:hypothetical protein
MSDRELFLVDILCKKRFQIPRFHLVHDVFMTYVSRVPCRRVTSKMKSPTEEDRIKRQ